MITTEQFEQILPSCKDPETWSFELAIALPEFDITTKQRIAMFIAQCGHESSEFNVLEENLNYSQQALRRVFPKYFPDDKTAFRYARQPKWIASRVYGGRMGNGGEQSMDGWKYRGRGVIQLTGKNNYRRCSSDLFGDDRLLHEPDILLEPWAALRSAMWFWDVNNLNRICDTGDFTLLTRRINGGTNGISHREQLLYQAMKVL